MGAAKKSRNSATKISSAADPATRSASRPTGTSSILRSSFAPSQYQLSLFASVIQSFDSQHLRIHDTLTGRLQCEHKIAPKSIIQCLDWGFLGNDIEDDHVGTSKRKRKRSEAMDGADLGGNAKDVVLAYGTSESEIHMYSPTDAKIVGLLSHGHSHGIRDFKFSKGPRSTKGWSVGGDGRLVQWDIQKRKCIRTLTVPDPSTMTLCPFGKSVICASNKVFIINPESTEKNFSVATSSSPIHSILTSTTSPLQNSCFLTAAESDRFINVFDTHTDGIIGSLVADSDAVSLALSQSHERATYSENNASVSASSLQVLAAINKDGILEIFEAPFSFSQSSAQEKSESIKARFKRRTRKSTAQIKVTRPNNQSISVPLINVSFQGDDCILAWAEGGINVVFESIPWRGEDNGQLLLKGTKEIIRSGAAAISGASITNGVKEMDRLHVNESKAVVANSGNLMDTHSAKNEPEVIDISSGEEDTDDAAEQLPLETASPHSVNNSLPKLITQTAEGSVSNSDIDMPDIETNDLNGAGEIKEADEPSFGELIRANAPEPVDVQVSLAAPNLQSLATVQNPSLQAPPGMSLGTVLTQSLRTNDISLLETCFHVQDLKIIRATIERLASPLASMLLLKLAERLHSRPGRAGSLMVWIQWTIVAHGGYLATQPEVIRNLTSLHHVIGDRAKSLPSLLSLKGKLDMLEAQMNLRRTLKAQSLGAKASSEDEEEGVIYVEGQEESASASDVEDKETEDANFGEEQGEEEEDGVDEEESGESVIGQRELKSQGEILVNGDLMESDEEQNGSGENGFFDEEASSTDQDSTDEDTEEIDYESVDSSGSSERDAGLPEKRHSASKLVNGLASKSRNVQQSSK